MDVRMEKPSPYDITNFKDHHEACAWWEALAKDIKMIEFHNMDISCTHALIGRYFDGTEFGLRMIFLKVRGGEIAVPIGSIRPQESERDPSKTPLDDITIDRRGLVTALKKHFGFFPDHPSIEHAEESEPFQRLCKAIGASEPNSKISEEMFGYVVRSLRIGCMSGYKKVFQTAESKLYYYDYDDDTMVGSWVPSTETQRAYCHGTWFNKPMTSTQQQVGLEYSVFKETASFLHQDLRKRAGRVHWVHLQEPSAMMQMALCQHYRVPIFAQCVICSLGSTYAQFELGHIAQGVPASFPSWSFVVLPAIYMSVGTRASLYSHLSWEASGRPQSEQPPLRVHVVQTKIGVVWSNVVDEMTVLSFSSQKVCDLGCWFTDERPEEQAKKDGWFGGLCARRRKDGYIQVPQDETLANMDDIEEARLDNVQDMKEDNSALGRKSLISGEYTGAFEREYESVLGQLGDDDSLLRMGSHWQLVFAIMQHRTQEYLDIVKLYNAAIRRVECLLREPYVYNKDELIGKIAGAKLQLSKIKRLVQPFADEVVPRMVDQVLGDFAEEEEKTGEKHINSIHELYEIKDNLSHFMLLINEEIDVCDTAIEDYDRASGDRSNNILNILTFITFVVTPLQILTGLYGMNFRKMPELEYRNGYYYFWWLAGGMTLLALCINFLLIRWAR